MLTSHPTVSKRRGLEPRHFAPLASFVLPTLLIGYGFVIPRSCIAGWNELSVGFGVTVASACITYWMGLRVAARSEVRRDGEA